MLNPLGYKAKLLKEVEGLCLFNDKGWGGDCSSPEKIEAERDRRLTLIRSLTLKVGSKSLPKGFNESVENGDIREEMGGKYYNLLKSHFSKSDS